MTYMKTIMRFGKMTKWLSSICLLILCAGCSFNGVSYVGDPMQDAGGYRAGPIIVAVDYQNKNDTGTVSEIAVRKAVEQRLAEKLKEAYLDGMQYSLSLFVSVTYPDSNGARRVANEFFMQNVIPTVRIRANVTDRNKKSYGILEVTAAAEYSTGLLGALRTFDMAELAGDAAAKLVPVLKATIDFGKRNDLTRKGLLGISRQELKGWARAGKISDLDVLKRLGKPSSIWQFSNGRKTYVFQSVENEKVGGVSMIYGDVLSFAFDRIGLLDDYSDKNMLEMMNDILSQPTIKNYIAIENDDDLLKQLENLPAKAGKALVKQKFGMPMHADAESWTYMTRRDGIGDKFLRQEAPVVSYFSDKTRMFSVTFKKSGRIDYLTMDKDFYDSSVSGKYRLKFDVVTTWERGPDQRELEVINASSGR